MNDDIGIALGERLERIAVALEAIQAHLKPSDLAAYNAVTPAKFRTSEIREQAPPDPEPPFPVPVLAISAPVPNWGVGMVHTDGHSPLRVNSRGLFCPTKLPDGSWCKWHPAV